MCQVLAYIGHTSPEVVGGRRLDAAGPSPLPPGAEDELVCALVAHRNAERQYLAARDRYVDDMAVGYNYLLVDLNLKWMTLTR